MPSLPHASSRQTTEIVADISAISLFKNVDMEKRTRLAGDIRLMSIGAGEAVIEQGDLTSDVYFVLAGQLIGTLLSQSGKEVTFTEFRVGSYFGELSALDARPRSITISAATRSVLGHIPAETFRRWIDDVPMIAQNLVIDLSDRNRRLTDRIYGLVIHDVRDRVRILLSGIAQARGQFVPNGVLTPAPTHEIMATHIGANREAVSRVIAQLTREGVIDASRQKIILRNIPALMDGL